MLAECASFLNRSTAKSRAVCRNLRVFPARRCMQTACERAARAVLTSDKFRREILGPAVLSAHLFELAQRGQRVYEEGKLREPRIEREGRAAALLCERTL